MSTRQNPTLKTVEENYQLTILLSMQFQTDKAIANSKQDTVKSYLQNETYLLLDITIPSGYNIIEKRVEK